LNESIMPVAVRCAHDNQAHPLFLGSRIAVIVGKNVKVVVHIAEHVGKDCRENVKVSGESSEREREKRKRM